MRVFDPYEIKNKDFDKMVEEWITDKRPGYFRV